MSKRDKVRGMDLETYRTKRGLTYESLAHEIGVTQAKQARAYALGHIWPRAKRLQRIIKACSGVTIDAMHARRLRFDAERDRFLRSPHRQVA